MKEIIETSGVGLEEKKVIGINPYNLNPKYQFNNFVVGMSNVIAAEVCQEIVKSPGKEKYNPLFIYGAVGVGKTHLMQAIASGILEADDKAKVLYVTSEQFTWEIINAIKTKTTDKLREKYRSVDVLLIDDIQFIMDKEYTTKEFLNIFDTIYDKRKQIILSSNVVPQDIEKIEDMMKSRFEGGLVVNIEKPEYETRLAIVKEKLKREYLGDIPEEVYAYIADNITDNVRRLEGAVNKVAVYFGIMDEKVTLEGVVECLKDFVN